MDAARDSKRQVLLVTCSSKPDLTASDAVLAAAIRSGGGEIRVEPWDGIAADTLGDITVCLRSTWDYHHRPDEFRTWIRSLQAAGASLWNPAETVLANIDKRYLADLAELGIAIPPTIWLEPGVDVDPAALLRQAGWERGVLKPRISATAHGTVLVGSDSTGDPVDLDPIRAAGGLLQCFVPEVVERGEVSLVFIAGICTHAVRKRARVGDFRVQLDFGGTAMREGVDRELERFGHRALETFGRAWLYARVDVVETVSGPMLMELELIEPDLFLDQAPEAAERLGQSLVGAS